jgi:hypothetical protein
VHQLPKIQHCQHCLHPPFNPFLSWVHNCTPCVSRHWCSTCAGGIPQNLKIQDLLLFALQAQAEGATVRGVKRARVRVSQKFCRQSQSLLVYWQWYILTVPPTYQVNACQYHCRVLMRMGPSLQETPLNVSRCECLLTALYDWFAGYSEWADVYAHRSGREKGNKLLSCFDLRSICIFLISKVPECKSHRWQVSVSN